MNRMTTLRLIEAIRAIQRIYPNDVITSIEFEDGSGNSFNYSLNGSKSKYIHWSTICDMLGYNPDNLATIKS